MDSPDTRDGFFGTLDMTVINQDSNQVQMYSHNQDNIQSVNECYSQFTDQSTEKEKLPQGTESCLNLEFPPNVLLNCCRLKSGQAMHVAGIAKKLEGGSEAIKMNIKRHTDAICFSLQGLERLCDIWQCSFVKLEDEITNSSESISRGLHSAPSVRPRRKSKKLIGRLRKKWKRPVVIIGQQVMSNTSEKEEQICIESTSDYEQRCKSSGSVYKNDVTGVLKDDTNFCEKSHGSVESGFSAAEWDELAKVESLRVKNAGNEVKSWKRGKRLSVHADSELYALNKAAILDMKGKAENSDAKQECLICGEVFVQEHNLPRHIKHYHSVSVKEYKEFLRSPTEERREKIAAFWQMARLEKEHEFRECKSSMLCQFCGELQDGTLAMRYHLKIKHSEEAGVTDQTQNYFMVGHHKEDASEQKHKYPCRYCGLMLAFICSRSRHENYYCTMNPSKKKLFCCSRCSKCFTNRRELQQHKLTHQPDDSRFVCDVCGKVRNTKSGLYQHKLKDHSGMADRFSCHICQKTFFTKDKYQRHLTVHVDLRPFVCELCGKTFKTKQAVTKHQRSVHSNKYPYHCDKCGHGVEKIQYLKSHRCGHVRRSQAEDNGMSTEPVQHSITKMMRLESDDQHLMDTDQTDKAQPQYVLSGAPPVFNTQQMSYLDLNQVAAQADNQQYMPQQPISQAYALPVGISLSQYSHVNYLQIPETERQQVITADMLNDNVNVSHINPNEIPGYNTNKIVSQVAHY